MLWEFGPEFYSENPAEFAGWGLDYTNSAQQFTLARGTFNTNMRFDDFPFDVQRLKLINMYTDGSTELVASSVGYKPVPASYEPAPGWSIVGVHQSLAPETFTFGNLSREHVFANGVQGHNFTGMTPSIHYVLEVRRVSSFYMMNLVLPVVMLNVLSWSSFLLQPAAIDVRLATTMTILIALVAFQFIVNDMLPKTGSLTRMHVFLTVSNVMIVLGGLESLMLYYLVEQDVSTVRDFVRHLGCGACMLTSSCHPSSRVEDSSEHL